MTDDIHVTPTAVKVEIEFIGGVREDADALRADFQKAGLPVEAVREISKPTGTLGAGEIILTLVASAAARGAAEMAFDHLRIYLKKKLSEGEKSVNRELKLSVTIKQAGGDREETTPFSLRSATVEAVDKFATNLSKILVALIKF